MDIEKVVSKAASAGVKPVIGLADRLGEKAHVVYDILERNHPDVYRKVQQFFEDEDE